MWVSLFAVGAGLVRVVPCHLSNHTRYVHLLLFDLAVALQDTFSENVWL